MYINAIDYDGEAQSVTLQTGEDLTLEGVFGLRRYFKRYGDPFGAVTRPTA